MEQTPSPSDTQTQGPDQLSDIEIRRRQNRCDEITSELAASFNQESRRHRVAMRLLLMTEAFTEQDLQQMLRGQILAPTWERPCQTRGSREYRDNLEVLEARRFSQGRLGDPLDPVPVARHRLQCPLYERGRRGDPLVPCYYAQRANPKAPPGKLEGAPFLPADLPAEQRQAIDFFAQERNDDLMPCRILQQLCEHDLSRQIETGAEALYQIRPRPVPSAPQLPPARKDDLVLRRHRQARQALLEEQARQEADAELHHRELLRHLIQTGRLDLNDLWDLTYKAVMVTDQGWLPCRDDPQRTYLEPLREDDYIPGPGSRDPLPQRALCGLTVRAMEGDRTVPCCEAQKVLPSHRAAEVKARDDRAKAHFQAYWRRQGGVPAHLQKPKEPPNWVEGAEDAPGGPQDIVRLLRIRPCYLLGHTAASYLYEYGQFLYEHPELDLDGPAQDGPDGE